MLRNIALGGLALFMLPKLTSLRSQRAIRVMKGIAAHQQKIWPSATANAGKCGGESPELVAHLSVASTNINASSAEIHPQVQQQQGSSEKSKNPPPQQQDPPVLLLEGDSLHVSSQGIARSFYQLNDGSSLTMEERYHLEDATKSFIMRQRGSQQDDGAAAGVVKPLDHVEIQEIDTQLAGTGGTTWEASIAMSLYFANHPEQLHGDVIELGSGVGLGGILLSHATNKKNNITLTDIDRKVLTQCDRNIESLKNKHGSGSAQMHVEMLDWYDVLKKQRPPPEAGQAKQTQYNTVIACDCAYRIKDAEALSETLWTLLLPDKAGGGTPRNKVHLFGPYNRVAFREVIDLLKSHDDLEVHTDWIEMSRYRLQAKSTLMKDATSVIQHPYHNHDVLASEYDIEEWQLEDDLRHAASLSSPKFLHVTAFYKEDRGDCAKEKLEQQQESVSSRFSDID